jgi:hypothetical protein
MPPTTTAHQLEFGSELGSCLPRLATSVATSKRTWFLMSRLQEAAPSISDGLSYQQQQLNIAQEQCRENNNQDGREEPTANCSLTLADRFDANVYLSKAL